MTITIFLAVSGLFLVFLEFFLPGAIMGIGGGVLLIASLIHFYLKNDNFLLFFTYFLSLLIFLYITIKLALYSVKASAKKGTMYLNTDQEGFHASNYVKEMIGKNGIASSDLKPSGHIFIENEYFSATSRDGYIERGSKITVVGGEGSHLKVTIGK